MCPFWVGFKPPPFEDPPHKCVCCLRSQGYFALNVNPIGGISKNHQMNSPVINVHPRPIEKFAQLRGTLLLDWYIRIRLYSISLPSCSIFSIPYHHLHIRLELSQQSFIFCYRNAGYTYGSSLYARVASPGEGVMRFCIFYSALIW